MQLRMQWGNVDFVSLSLPIENPNCDPVLIRLSSCKWVKWKKKSNCFDKLPMEKLMLTLQWPDGPLEVADLLSSSGKCSDLKMLSLSHGFNWVIKTMVNVHFPWQMVHFSVVVIALLTVRQSLDQMTMKSKTVLQSKMLSPPLKNITFTTEKHKNHHGFYDKTIRVKTTTQTQT